MSNAAGRPAKIPTAPAVASAAQAPAPLAFPAQQAPVSLLAAAAGRPELWSPAVVGRVNDHYIKAVRVQGDFPWHTHEAEDEMFLVLQGVLRIGRAACDGGPVDVRAGEFFVVPRGVHHNTSTPGGAECLLALVEPAATLHSGAVASPLTRSVAEQLRG